MPMANLQIKDLPEEIHQELRRRAGAQGMTLRQYVENLIVEDLRRPSKQEWLTRIRARPAFHLEVALAELLRDDRDGRSFAG